MKQIGLLKAIRMTYKANKLSIEERKYLQQQRLQKLVQYAKANSPYFAEKYAGLDESFTLQDLPITNKVELMSCFNEWVTDENITLEKVERFMDNKDNIGRKMDDKYLVNTTSGSTGNPAVVLYDETTMNVVSAIAVLRSFARAEDMKKFLKKGKKTVGLFADGGFYLGCGTVRYNQLRMPWKKDQIIIDVRKPMDEIVASLNEFQPVMLGGYPTALELLVEEQKSGRLQIEPVIIMTGGEYLSDNLRKQLAETFNCYVQTNYSCTEGGTIACECREGHFHINEDWVIVEAVDEQNNAVPYGQLAHKLLLTNLFNYTQPFLRYELTDRAILHNEPCPCGKNTMWVEIEGRTDDILTFEHGKKIAPLSLYALLKEVHSIKRFQLIQHNERLLELRISADNKEEAFIEAKFALQQYLQQQGIETDVYLSQEEPQSHPQSGKFKHIYKA